MSTDEGFCRVSVDGKVTGASKCCFRLFYSDIAEKLKHPITEATWNRLGESLINFFHTTGWRGALEDAMDQEGLLASQPSTEEEEQEDCSDDIKENDYYVLDNLDGNLIVQLDFNPEDDDSEEEDEEDEEDEEEDD